MKSGLTLVRCTKPYWEFVRELRTDPRVAAGFTQRARITPEQQKAYMAKHWREYFVCLQDGKPAGYVGSIDRDIRICTHPDFQRTGVGAFMVNELMKIFPDSFAKIKLHNESSRRLFEKCGFVPKYIIYERGLKASARNRNTR